MNVKEKHLDIRVINEEIFKRRENVNQLQKKYDSMKTSSQSASDCRLKCLHYEYSKLRAEIQVLEESKPERIPKCKPLLFVWACKVLQEDIRNLEELLSFQKNMKKISSEKELELTKLCKKEQIESDSLNESLACEDLLEDEKLKSEILQCLHRKLVRRLRRISRDYYRDLQLKNENVATNVLLDKPKKQKSMFSILKELFAELQDISATFEEWEKTLYVKVDKKKLQNVVQMLLDYNIVEFSPEDDEKIKLII